MTHLTDEQIAKYLGVAEDATVRDHLELCPECRDELAGLTHIIGSAKSAILASSPVEPAFWARQRAVIRTSATRRHTRMRAAAVAAAFVVLLTVSTALLRVHTARPAAGKAVAASISDDALLAVVGQELQQQVPDALAPAQLLVNAREKAEDTGMNVSADSRSER